MKELKFIHITKCAGTFIENIGKSKNIDWGIHHFRTGEYGHWHQPFLNKSIELDVFLLVFISIIPTIKFSSLLL